METGHNTTVSASYLDLVKSLNASYNSHIEPVPLDQPVTSPASTSTKASDPSGEGYYVIAVFLVYGMSIVLLIASHIRRKHSKLAIDKEICKYLQEFQIVKETSSRDSYRNLKRSIIAKLSREKHSARKGIGNITLPMVAVALPRDPPSYPDDNAQDDDDDDDDDVQVVVEVSEEGNNSYTGHDIDVDEKVLIRQGKEASEDNVYEANGCYGKQSPELRQSSRVSGVALGGNDFYGDHQLNNVKEAELMRRYAFDRNGYHVIRIPEVRRGEAEAVGRCADDAKDYHQAIRIPQLRRLDERKAGTGISGRRQSRTKPEVGRGLRLSPVDYHKTLRQGNVGLALASRDPRWILLPHLLENRLRTERQDHEVEGRKEDEENEEEDEEEEGRKEDDEDEEEDEEEEEEEEKCRDGDREGAGSSAGGTDDVISYTYVL